MQRKGVSRRIIQSAIAASVIAGVLLAGGFAYGTYAALGGVVADGSSPTANQPQAPSPSSPRSRMVHVVALGDSLAHGLGDASGNGFVGDVSARYRHQGHTVIQSNLGIDGLTSGGLLQELKQPSVQSVLPSANVILVSIGGNDLNDSAGLPAINTAKIGAAKRAFRTNLTLIFRQIRKLNATASILLVGLYNPYGDVASSKAQTDAIIQSWDLEEDRVAEQFPNTVVVQTFDLFALNGPQFLYLDHFHPNQAGYQRIADRIWQDLQQ